MATSEEKNDGGAAHGCGGGSCCGGPGRRIWIILAIVVAGVLIARNAGKKYGISMIPTQIFYDAAGKELARHEGFLGKEDILAKWQELGVDLTAAAPPGTHQ